MKLIIKLVGGVSSPGYDGDNAHNQFGAGVGDFDDYHQHHQIYNEPGYDMVVRLIIDFGLLVILTDIAVFVIFIKAFFSGLQYRKYNWALKQMVKHLSSYSKSEVRNPICLHNPCQRFQ